MPSCFSRQKSATLTSKTVLKYETRSHPATLPPYTIQRHTTRHHNHQMAVNNHRVGAIHRSRQNREISRGTDFPLVTPACFQRSKVKKRWGSNFGGRFPWLRAKTTSPAPRKGRGGGKARGHAPFEQVLDGARRGAEPRTGRRKEAESGVI